MLLRRYTHHEVFLRPQGMEDRIVLHFNPTWLGSLLGADAYVEVYEGSGRIWRRCGRQTYASLHRAKLLYRIWWRCLAEREDRLDESPEFWERRYGHAYSHEWL